VPKLPWRAEATLASLRYHWVYGRRDRSGSYCRRGCSVRQAGHRRNAHPRRIDPRSARRRSTRAGNSGRVRLDRRAAPCGPSIRGVARRSGSLARQRRLSLWLLSRRRVIAPRRHPRAAGHDVSDVRDAGLRGAPDEEVFARACSEGRILISGDVDFANTLRFRPGSHVGIVVLRLPNDWAPAARAERALLAIADILPELGHGALAVVDSRRVRLLRPAGP